MNAPTTTGTNHGHAATNEFVRCRPGATVTASHLDRDPSGVVDALQEQGRRGGEVLVDREPATVPVAVVVDDEHAAGREARVEVLEFVFRRLVPVGVEAQQRDGGRCGGGQGVL